MHGDIICMSVLCTLYECTLEAQERLDIFNPLVKLAWVCFLRLGCCLFFF